MTLPAVGDLITAAQGDQLLAPPLFMAHQAVAQSIPNNTITALTFDTADVDTYTGWSSGANTKYTSQLAGYYHVDAVVAFAGNATGRRIIYTFKNGSQEMQVEVPNGAANACYISIARRVYLAVSDYLEIKCFQSSGGALSTTVTGAIANSYIHMHWVSM